MSDFHLTFRLFSFHGLVTVFSLGVFLLASRTLRQRRHPSAAIAWFLSLALMPYVALPIYLLVGNRKLTRPQPAHRSLPIPLELPDADQHVARLRTLARSLTLPEPSSFDFFELHRDGSHALASLLSVIENAKVSLDICTFLLGNDVLGRAVVAQLAASAKRGVAVRFMLDGVGQYLGGHPDLQQLKMAGVSVSLFSPPLRFLAPGGVNLRNHRKIAIADGSRLWIGGRNLAAEYFVGDSGGNHSSRAKSKAWIDLSFELRGLIARQVQDQFHHDWEFAMSGRTAEMAPPIRVSPGHVAPTVQLVPSGPDQSDDTVYSLLISSLFAAQTRIIAVSPYYVPDPSLQMALTLAARRGVVVDLVLPRESNHKMADIARAVSLRELAISGARVWLVPQMVHAKAIVIDDSFALVGTANLDERSLFLNYELMVGFYEPEVIEQFVQWLLTLRERAELYQPQRPSILREMGEGLVRVLAFQL